MSRITTTKRGRGPAPGGSVKPEGPQTDLEGSGPEGSVLRALDILEALYGNDRTPPEEYSTGEPLDGLILTLLSQNTNDRNRDMAYNALRKKYPTWDEVAALDPAEIAALIRPAGLGETKSSRMSVILARIDADFGGFTLKAMHGWSPEDARRYLSALPGVGPKTVACVMVFDLGMPAFPVDTHVARVSRRLGLVPERTAPEKIQEFLESVVPPERCGGGHLNMIEHGRAVCHARRPECGTCAAAGICAYVAAAGGGTL
ncbi:MAG: endonuclease III [Synergistaceae bacterium]|jgi:endonuclease-3|nr:endonuclease III [Synergistaceae bacterium]